MRRDFSLPEVDEDFLIASGFVWETWNDGAGMWLIIKNYSIPNGYTVSQSDLALKIDPGYPVSQIDMVYFSNELKITGKTIGALAMQPIGGINWQRWSRHRTGENPWREGVDDVSTHLQMVNYWMERELKK